ncbi:hypothetical protein [Pseudomonas sp. SDO52101_S400]
MLTAPVFKPWRPLWDTQFPEMMQKVDELAAMRQAGRQLPPSLADMEAFVNSPDALEGAVGQTLTPEFLKNNLEPILNASVWPRWILLEHLLEYAASTGDLHLSAMALRTQIEELDVLHVAATVLSTPKENWNSDAIEEAICTLQRRVLPRTATKDSEQLQEKSSDKDLADLRPEPLKQAFEQLSEYVHPNYGSHVLSVRPQSLEAAQVLAEAFIAVYDDFFTLPWAHESGEEATQDPYFTLADKTVPGLNDKKILEEGWEEALEKAADTFRHLGKCESNWNIKAPWPTDVEAIHVLSTASIAPQHWPQAFRTLSGVNRYSHLVMQEHQLTELVASLNVDVENSQSKTSLPVLVSGLCFSINLIEYKVTVMSRHAAHLINTQNVLGAALVVRSILEHHALAVELSKKLRVMWNDVQKQAPNDGKIATAITSAVKQLSRVLAGTSESGGIPSGWRTLWKDTVKKHYNVMLPIEALESRHPGTLQVYGLLSHIMHGTVATGGDLLGAGGEGWKNSHKKLEAQLTIMLSDYCGFDAMMERQVEVIIIGPLLQTLQIKEQNLGESIKSMRITDGQKLKNGRDIFGDGTEESPYFFREGLDYYHAYHCYLKQEGIKVLKRTPTILASGMADRVEIAGGKTLHFLAPRFSE